MKKRQRKHLFRQPYSAMQLLTASTTEQMPEDKLVEYMNKVDVALLRLNSEDGGRLPDWNVLSDAVNLMDMFHIREWVGDDALPAIKGASDALVQAGLDVQTRRILKLDGENYERMVDFIAEYGRIIRAVSARSFMDAFNAMAKEIWEHEHGKAKKHVVDVRGLPA